VYINQNF